MRRVLLLSIILLAGLLASCTGAPTPGASGRADNTAMVLAEPVEPASLNPLAGYAPNGEAKIFDGLVEHQADGSLRPVLADALPEVSADGKSWTVTLRSGVKFSDGTAFSAQDVLATYRALLDPVFASPLRPAYAMLTGVDAVNATTVRFQLSYPYPPFPNLLTLGILPAAALATPQPVTQLAANSKPVGTGPYQLTSWTRGQQLVLTANPGYFGGAPKIKKVTVKFVADDTQRSQLLRAGRLDGTALSPAQAVGYAQSDAFTVFTERAADLRGVQLPTSGVGADPAMRLALNYAVNRVAMVSGALAGNGTAASTPLPDVLAEFVEPTATFDYDKAKAASLLDQAGWVVGADGVRARAGVQASLTLDYPTGDSVDASLANSFAADAKAIGVAVHATAVDPAQLADRAATDAVMISAGNPFDPDLAVYPLLGSALAEADARQTAALETGRRETDPAQRAVAYRQFQRAYVADPTMVCLVFASHTYVMRDNWTGYQRVDDGPGQDVTWGPWWNLETWVPR